MSHFGRCSSSAVRGKCDGEWGRKMVEYGGAEKKRQRAARTPGRWRDLGAGSQFRRLPDLCAEVGGAPHGVAFVDAEGVVEFLEVYNRADGAELAG
jgi:hypothetical protein